jgi:hypothetical protein
MASSFNPKETISKHLVNVGKCGRTILTSPFANHNGHKKKIIYCYRKLLKTRVGQELLRGLVGIVQNIWLEIAIIL